MNNPTQLTDISSQLAHVADELRLIAKKLEQTQSHPTVEPTTAETDKFELLSEIPQALGQEAEAILQDAINQISGSKPEKCNPDQLYGWADSLQKVLGTTVSAPTSEVRKLQDLIDQLTYHLEKHN